MAHGNLLSKDEVVVRHMHTHIKAILGNIFAAILMVAVGVLASIFLPRHWSPYSHIIIWTAVLVASVPMLLIPLLRWSTSTYTVTSKRIITRHGIINKTGHDLPISRISDVTIECSLMDRIFGCGTLTLQTSADDPLPLNDIPRVEYVQAEISNLLFHDVQGAIDADPDD